MSSTPPDSAQLLTVEQVADLFQVKVRTVYQLVRDGLPHLRVGKLLQFRAVDLHRWAESRSTALAATRPTAPAPALVSWDGARRSMK